MLTSSLFWFNWEANIQDGVKLEENKAASWNMSVAPLEKNNRTEQLIRFC